MREIKFRAWDGFRMINRTLFDRNWYTCTKDERLAKEALPRDKNTLKVMQYTGLKDKNGKEIYEGDILSYGKFALNDTEKYGIRCWEKLPDGVNESDISTVLESFEVEFTPEGLMSLKSCIENNPDVVGVEVIGNIYENKELLE